MKWVNGCLLLPGNRETGKDRIEFMYRFYVEESQIKETKITIVGSDVNHIKNVLRLKCQDEIVICNGQGKDFYCIIEEMSKEVVKACIQSVQGTGRELPVKIYLFQGLPKKDKLELIIQKAVELGVYEIIPIMTKRTVVKLEDKKKELKKLERWQSIATSAAKQSMRGIIPKVAEAMDYKSALHFAKALDYKIIPYEKEEDILRTKGIFKEARGSKTIGVFIGPEGGFEENEISMAVEQGIQPVTLGRRILRTETAGFTVLSIIMFEIEG